MKVSPAALARTRARIDQEREETLIEFYCKYPDHPVFDVVNIRAREIARRRNAGTQERAMRHQNWLARITGEDVPYQADDFLALQERTEAHI